MKKISKNDQQGYAHIVLIVSILVVLIGLLGFVYWGNFIEPQALSNGTSYHCGRDVDCSELNGPTYVVKGQVTRKTTSCGLEVLQSDGTVRQGGGICDGGNGLEVEGLRVSTGGGALGGRPPKYVSDIESIHAGDRVEVRYAKDDSGYASTNCKACYVKKL